MTQKILRGQDIEVLLKLRNSAGDPYDLTDVTLITLKFRKPNGGFYDVTSTPVAAVKAAVSFQSVTYTAVTAGAAGNNIILNFDGVMSIAAVISAWNAGHPSNQVSSNASNASVVPTVGVATLVGGRDTYTNVEMLAPLLLGNIRLILTETDTNQLAVIKRSPLIGIIDSGPNPTGKRTKFIIEDAFDIVDSP